MRLLIGSWLMLARTAIQTVVGKLVRWFHWRGHYCWTNLPAQFHCILALCQDSLTVLISFSNTSNTSLPFACVLSPCMLASILSLNLVECSDWSCSPSSCSLVEYSVLTSDSFLKHLTVRGAHFVVRYLTYDLRKGFFMQHCWFTTCCCPERADIVYGTDFSVPPCPQYWVFLKDWNHLLPWQQLELENLAQWCSREIMSFHQCLVPRKLKQTVFLSYTGVQARSDLVRLPLSYRVAAIHFLQLAFFSSPAPSIWVFLRHDSWFQKFLGNIISSLSSSSVKVKFSCLCKSF